MNPEDTIPCPAPDGMQGGRIESAPTAPVGEDTLSEYPLPKVYGTSAVIALDLDELDDV